MEFDLYHPEQRTNSGIALPRSALDLIAYYAVPEQIRNDHSSDHKDLKAGGLGHDVENLALSCKAFRQITWVNRWREIWLRPNTNYYILDKVLSEGVRAQVENVVFMSEKGNHQPYSKSAWAFVNSCHGLISMDNVPLAADINTCDWNTPNLKKIDVTFPLLASSQGELDLSRAFPRSCRIILMVDPPPKPDRKTSKKPASQPKNVVDAPLLALPGLECLHVDFANIVRSEGELGLSRMGVDLFELYFLKRAFVNIEIDGQLDLLIVNWHQTQMPQVNPQSWFIAQGYKALSDALDLFDGTSLHPQHFRCNVILSDAIIMANSYYLQLLMMGEKSEDATDALVLTDNLFAEDWILKLMQVVVSMIPGVLSVKIAFVQMINSQDPLQAGIVDILDYHADVQYDWGKPPQVELRNTDRTVARRHNKWIRDRVKWLRSSPDAEKYRHGVERKYQQDKLRKIIARANAGTGFNISGIDDVFLSLKT